MNAHVYIDTHGASRDVSRQIPNGVRIAVHIPGRDALELHAEPDGSYRLQVGPELGQSGEWTPIARGRTVRRFAGVTRHRWVVCSPGNPTGAQWQAIYARAEQDLCTATHFDERSGAVRFTVWRENGAEDHYEISRDCAITERSNG